MLKVNCRSKLIAIGLIVVSLSFAAQLLGTPLIHSASASAPAKSENVTARLIADTTAIQPGLPFHLGVELIMQPGWHTYYKEPGDAGMATKIDWLLPSYFSAKALKWEKPTRLDDKGIVSYIYEKKTLISAEIVPPAKLQPGTNIELGARVRWLSCRELCVPGGQEVKLTLPVVSSPNAKVSQINSHEFATANFDGPASEIGSSSATNQPTNNVLDENLTIAGSSGSSISFLGYVALAFVGGIILNFMPCVLPVVAIKILSLFEQAEKDSSKVRLLGLIFSAGIISSFLLLAAFVIAFQAAGHKIGWGFQFQYPPFVVAMATIVLLFALGLFGQLNFAFSLGEKECTKISEKEGFLGTFFKGVLATILSTPCTAPFLGTAIGFAFVKPWWTILTIFLSVGLGMAAPYLLLTMNPNWMKFLPKPGVWMEKLKEAFGFVLLATVAWLVSVFGNQVGIDGFARMIYFLLIIAVCAWIVSRFCTLSSTASKAFITKSLALTIGALAFYFLIYSQPGFLGQSPGDNTASKTNSSQDPDGWQPFSIASLNANLQAGKTVFLDFSAKWCLTCQANENFVLRSNEVQDKIKALHVVLLQADWTSQDPAITAILQKFGRSGVPLYVIFPAKAPDHPIVLPEVIDKSLVLQKLDEATSNLSSAK
jgi:thiol:disulfide interchange protein